MTSSGTPLNDEERTYKQEVAKYFREAKAPDYGVDARVFVEMGRRLVKWAQIPSAARVLDVAAGRGAVLFPAAEQVGERGRVVGIDLAESMVRATAAEIYQRGLKNAEIRQMDAEELEFPDASFDRVLCGFALFFFPHLDRALAEFFRVLKLGGWLAATTFGEGADERWAWYEPLLEAYGLSRAGTARWRSMRGTENGHSRLLSKPDELRTVLGEAGFVSIQVVEDELDLVYADEGKVWEHLYSSGDRVLFDRLTPGTLHRLKSEIFEKLRFFKQVDGFHQLFRVLLTLGARPGY